MQFGDSSGGVQMNNMFDFGAGGQGNGEAVNESFDYDNYNMNNRLDFS